MKILTLNRWRLIVSLIKSLLNFWENVHVLKPVAKKMPSRKAATAPKINPTPNVTVIQKRSIVHGRQHTVSQGDMTTVIRMVTDVTQICTNTSNHVQHLDERLADIRQMVQELQRSRAREYAEANSDNSDKDGEYETQMDQILLALNLF